MQPVKVMILGAALSALALSQTLINSGANINGSNNYTFSAGTLGAHHLLVFCNTSYNTDLTGISDSNANTWSSIISFTAANGNRTGCAYIADTKAGATTVQTTISNGYESVYAWEEWSWSGTITLDKGPAAVSVTTATGWASGSTGTLSQATEIAIGWFASVASSGNSTSFTADTGWLAGGNNTAGTYTGMMEYKITSATTAITATATAGLAKSGAALILTFQNGAAAGSTLKRSAVIF